MLACRRRPGTGHHNFFDVVERRGHEVGQLLPLARLRDIGRDDIAAAFEQRGLQAVAGCREEHDVNAQVAGFQLGVEVRFELLQGIVRDAALHATVDEEVRLAVRHQHADHAALDHPVEIAGPRLGNSRGVERSLCLSWRRRLLRLHDPEATHEHDADGRQYAHHADKSMERRPGLQWHLGATYGRPLSLAASCRPRGGGAR